MRTRVGYAGGRKASPTYHALGDHSEAIEIVYDPTRLSYAQLLSLFWEEHDPTAKPWSRQYAALVLARDERQEKLAKLSRDALSKDSGKPIATEILRTDTFHPAEGYHQKYGLQNDTELWPALRELFGSDAAALDSTLAARLNGALAGHATRAEVEAELARLGAPVEKRTRLLERIRRSLRDDRR